MCTKTDKGMATITTEEIIEATGGELLTQGARSFSGVSIDSRTTVEDEVFFALKGEKFDGHEFVSSALKKGTGAVIDTGYPKVPDGKVVIHVKDTLKALQDLALFLRKKRDVPVIAITGSNGKTTTKEMTFAILSKRFRVLKNEGNLNNHIGLPLSLARISPDDEVIVLELGMNATGEIKRLCEIALPTHGIVTNIGTAHIGELGSLEKIREAKLEILDGLAVAVVNADDPFLMEGYTSAIEGGRDCGRLVTFSIQNNSYVKADNVLTTERGCSFTIKLQDGENTIISLNIHGLFNVYNALAAAAVSLSLGVTLKEIKTALNSYQAFPMRFEVLRTKDITIINDTYNANPSSMEESLKELAHMKDGGRTVALLGDMLELGKFSEKFHRSISATVERLNINVLVTVGEMMGLAAEECRKHADTANLTVYDFKTAGEAVLNLPNIINTGDVVLVKGSRAMGMEKIVDSIRG
ncbi:MAG: UDP-N-acetylmuramoyl-tripeptide--D-alanyl-D-alanine ligase [Nitrospiraceae bacterium]|nr:MAG: UDP-N-acetylmuramoyl-tripeptide--D-alanyl-D-alanine ligase [Nitrospiraceae bacterium]